MSAYRSYEDPYKLEQRLEALKICLQKEPENIDLALEVQDLEDRIRLAWADDEAEVNGLE